MFMNMKFFIPITEIGSIKNISSYKTYLH